MGNVFKPNSFKSEYLFLKPQPLLHCLVKCEFYSGTQTEILSIHLKYSGVLSRSRIEIDKHDFRRCTKDTKLEGKEELLYSIFNKAKKLNILEVFGAIIVYSACT